MANITADNILRDVNVDGFRLTTFDVNRQDRMGKHMVGYRFHARGGTVLFEGEDLACSPMHAIDSDDCLRSLLTFLTLRPGDTDSEYFAEYTEAQHEFAQCDAEFLSLWSEPDGGTFVDWDG